MPVGSVIRRVEGRPVRTQALLCELLAAKAAAEPTEPVEFEFTVGIQVRKTPSWPRSWANFNPLSLYSHRNAWASLHLLGQTNTFLAPALPDRRQRAGA